MTSDVKCIMDSWFYKHLGDAMTAALPSSKIREAFLSFFDSAGPPADMAVFRRNDSGERLHCEVYVYFSPAAAGIARAFEAKSCEQPLRRGLELLAGDKSCWSVLFRESDP